MLHKLHALDCCVTQPEVVMALACSIFGLICGRPRQKKKLLAVFGAGSSVTKGMPSVDDVGDFMRQCSATNAVKNRGPAYFQEIWNGVEAYYNRNPVLDHKPNFERILADLAELANWMKPAPFGTTVREIISAGNPPLGLNFPRPNGYGPTIDLFEELTLLLGELARLMRDRSNKLDTAAPRYQRYAEILRSLRSEFDFGIYNLNYDNVALSSWPDAFTGFTPSGDFSAKDVHERREWGFIYHLHGSVHHTLVGPFGDDVRWQNDLRSSFDDGHPGRSEKDVTDGKSLPKTTLIAGGFKLDQMLGEPFQSFYASLARHVYEADAILLGGYGFADPHVNIILNNRLKLSGNRPPIVVLSYADLRPGKFPEPMERRRDFWAWELSKALDVDLSSFRQPGFPGAPPDIIDLVKGRAFEVSQASRVAIWHGGFDEASERITAIVRWLRGEVGDEELGSIR